jgi:hypothetical protein
LTDRQSQAVNHWLTITSRKSLTDRQSQAVNHWLTDKGVITVNPWLTDSTIVKRKKDKGTNNDLQNITQKTKDWATLTPRQTWGWSQMPRKVKFLLHYWHLSCYSSYKPHDKSFFRLLKHNLFFSVPDPDAYLTADFSEILNNIRLALLSVSPKSHYYSGFLSRSLPFLYLHLPSCIGDKVMSVMVNWFEFVPKALSKPKLCHWLCLLVITTESVSLIMFTCHNNRKCVTDYVYLSYQKVCHWLCLLVISESVSLIMFSCHIRKCVSDYAYLS